MAMFRGELTCDGCSVPFDGDPIALLPNSDVPRGVLDPDKIRELRYFWLCVDCQPAYPRGAEDFFTSAFFTDDIACERCGGFISDDDYCDNDYSEVCNKCAPVDEPIDEPESGDCHLCNKAVTVAEGYAYNEDERHFTCGECLTQ